MTEEKNANMLDMYPLLSGEKDVIEISFDILPDAVPELGITFQEAFNVRGNVTNRSGYMRLQLCSDVPYETLCARCLKPIRKTQSVILDKTVAESGSLENEDADEIVDDYLLIEDGMLDLESPLIEQLMLVLPAKTLCDEDCLGLCPRCGHDLNEGPCGCATHEPDPRLACLASLLEGYSDDGEDSEKEDGSKSEC